MHLQRAERKYNRQNNRNHINRWQTKLMAPLFIQGPSRIGAFIWHKIGRVR